MSLAKLQIIIVNWNAGMQLRDCLRSIFQVTREAFDLDQVVVVDNASSDDSIRVVVDLCLPIAVVTNSHNAGFAAACNQGSAGSQADFLLFLNPDTILLRDSLTAPLHFMQQEENAKIGICGVQLIDVDGRVRRTCARFPSVKMFLAKMLGLDRILPRRFPPHNMLEWDHASGRIVDQVMGSFFLVRTSLFDSLGGFDERFFVYFEEVDFSLRALKTGWLSYYFSQAQAYHKGGGSSEIVKATRLYYSIRSRILYGFKHFSPLSAVILAFGSLFIEPVTRLFFAVVHLSLSGMRETIGGYLKIWLSTPRLFKYLIQSRA